jgi:hypothetical protein
MSHWGERAGGTWQFFAPLRVPAKTPSHHPQCMIAVGGIRLISLRFYAFSGLSGGHLDL